MKKLLLGLLALGAVNLSATDKIKIGADPTSHLLHMNMRLI